MRFRDRRRSPFRSRSLNFWRPVNVAAACALFLTLGWVPTSAARQADAEFEGVDGASYESPAWGYTLEWDEDVWEVAEAGSTRRGDTLRLGSDASDLVIEGLAGFDGDPADCLADRVERLTDRADEVEPFEDEDGDPVEGEEDDRAFAAFLVVGSVLDDEFADPDAQSVAYVECRILVEDEAVVRILHLAPESDYPDESELAAEVLETLTIPDAQGEEDEATEEPTEEATEEPEDEATEEPEEATEEADQDPEDAGVDGDTYESPTFGYTLEWDGDEWEVDSATSEDDVDTLTLANDASTLTIVGLADFDGDPATCLEETAAELEDGADVESFEPALNADGDPIEISEDGREGAVFLATVDGDELVYRVECRSLVEDEAVVQIVQEVPADDYGDQIAPVNAVLDTIALAGEEPEDEVTPEPEDEETPEPDDEETPEPDDEGDGAGVDGNSYVSPTFGYTLEWDEEDWEVSQATTDSDGDFLVLGGRRGSMTIWGLEEFGGDPLVCFSNFQDFLEEGDPQSGTEIEDFDPFEDEDGEVVEGEEDERVFGAFRIVEVDEDGIETEYVVYLDCRTLVPDEAVLIILHFLQPPEAYEPESERRDEVLGTLELLDEETDEKSDESEENLGDETPEAEDEQEKPEADGDQDENEPDAADEPGSGDLQDYTSRDFGYTVAWDRDVWILTDRIVEEGRDFIQLSSENGQLTFEGRTRDGGDPAACLTTATINLRAVDGVEDWARVTDADLLPEGRARGAGAGVLFSFVLAPEGRTPTPFYAYVECRVVVPDEVVLAVVYTVPTADYESERPALEAVLTAIELPAG